MDRSTFFLVLAALCLTGLLFADAISPEPKTVSRIIDFAGDDVAAGNTTVDLYWSGGIPKCSNCGQPGQYACSKGIGQWNNGTKTFKDPGPNSPGFLLTGITAYVYGTVSCTAASSVSMIMLTVNGQTVDVLTATSSNMCKCNTCDGALTFSSDIFFGGIPNYKYGKTNNIQLQVVNNNYICINRVSLNMTFTVPDWQSMTVTLPYRSSVSSQTCNVCAGGGLFACSQNQGWNSGVVTFADPLPKGTLLLNAVARAYIVPYNPYGYFGLTGTLAGVTVGATRLTPFTDNNYCSRCKSVTLGTDTYYQGGWPGYVYGGNNNFQLTLVGSQYDSYSGACVSFVQLTLGYYSLN